MAKTAAIVALLAGTALAMPRHGAVAQVALQADTPPAKPAAPTLRAPSRTTAEDIVVTSSRHPSTTGGGLIKKQVEAKSISTISAAYIATQASIQNAYQYVALTPGALVSTADPFGLSTQFSINIHGLGQDELGYVLEGMPLNDIGYYTAYPSQFIDSENIDEVSLAQGSADLDSPVISEAGGLMKISMLDPSVHRGGSVDASYGSFNTNREFIRLDSGLIGDTGIRAFVSYSHTGSDQWRGDGRVKRQHVDFKAVKEWGDGNRVTLSGEWHDGITPSYLKPTLESYEKYGAQAPENNYAHSFTPGGYDYWKDYVGTFRVIYVAAPSRFTLSDNFTLNVTPYWQYGYGNGPYEDVYYDQSAVYQGGAGPYSTSIPNFAANGGSVMANFEDLQYRAGLVTKLTYTTGANSIILGDWYDYSNESDIQSYSGLSRTGEPADIWAEQSGQLLRITSGPYAGKALLSNSDDVITQTNELFAADTVKLLDDKLSIEAGFKFAMIARDGVNQVPGPQYHADVNNAEPLPRFAVKYQIDPLNMVYVSASTDFRTPSEQTFFNQYYQGSLYYKANTNLKPEYAISETVGYRYSGPRLTLALSFFNYNFTNRQISTLGGGSSSINQSINAGGQTSRGVDFEAGTRPWHHISPYVSAEYLHATIDNNILVNSETGQDYLPTTGKTSVRSPSFQGAVGLNYDDGTFFGSFDVKYVGSQYATFMNDEKIPSYVTTDLGVGYRLPSFGLRARPELKLNFINMGSDYLASVANPTYNAKTTTGLHGQTIDGTSPTYYLSSGLAILFTAKQGF
jgi:iron complex outermembrane receptor protein